MPSARGHDEEDEHLPSRFIRKEPFAQILEPNTQRASLGRMGKQARTTWRIRTDNRRRRQCIQSVAYDYLTWCGVLLLDEQPEFNRKRLEIESRPPGKGADHDQLRSEQLGPTLIRYGYFMARPKNAPRG